MLLVKAFTVIVRIQPVNVRRLEVRRCHICYGVGDSTFATAQLDKNIDLNYMLNKKLGLFVVLAGLAAGDVTAQSLQSYAPGDVLLCFRGGSDYDLVVDAGSITNFINQTRNTTATISNYTGTQLSYVGINSIDWSAFTWLSDNTLFVTRPRASLNTQTIPWTDAQTNSQNQVDARMVTIPPGTVDEASLVPASSATAVIEENISDNNPNYLTGASYNDALNGSYGSDWDGKFQGNCENTTSGSFSTSGSVVRSDLYQLTPQPTSNGRPVSGVYLGYFQFSASGAMTYVAYPDSIPVIKSISRSGNISTINYTTGIYGNYTLKSTYSLQSPVTWTTVGTLSTGDANVHTVMDTDATAQKYYIIVGN